MSPEERANKLAGYFDWDIPSEQYLCVKHHIELALLEEREACAYVADTMLNLFTTPYNYSGDVAKAIRARGEKSNLKRSWLAITVKITWITIGIACSAFLQASTKRAS